MITAIAVPGVSGGTRQVTGQEPNNMHACPYATHLRYDTRLPTLYCICRMQICRKHGQLRSVLFVYLLVR